MKFRLSIHGKVCTSLCLYGFTLLLSINSPLSAQALGSRNQSKEEYIEIGETTYAIPKPWIGHKFPAPALSMHDFKQIPVEHTKDSSQLFIEKEAQSALIQLLAAAKRDGILLLIESGFRSASYQKIIFARMLEEGREFDDIIRYVAPPGYSQHALGTAVDFYPSNWQFASLKEYQWLRENGKEYGFTETYPRENPLHFPWEAWHWSFTKDTARPLLESSSAEMVSQMHPQKSREQLSVQQSSD